MPRCTLLPSPQPKWFHKNHVRNCQRGEADEEQLNQFRLDGPRTGEDPQKCAKSEHADHWHNAGRRDRPALPRIDQAERADNVPRGMHAAEEEREADEWRNAEHEQSNRRQLECCSP